MQRFLWTASHTKMLPSAASVISPCLSEQRRWQSTCPAYHLNLPGHGTLPRPQVAARHIIYAHSKAISGERLSSGTSFRHAGSAPPPQRSLIWHNRVTHAREVTNQCAKPPRGHFVRGPVKFFTKPLEECLCPVLRDVSNTTPHQGKLYLQSVFSA